MLAVVMRLHKHDASYDVVFIPETVDILALLEVAITTMRAVFCPYNGNFKRSKGANGSPN